MAGAARPFGEGAAAGRGDDHRGANRCAHGLRQGAPSRRSRPQVPALTLRCREAAATRPDRRRSAGRRPSWRRRPRTDSRIHSCSWRDPPVRPPRGPAPPPGPRSRHPACACRGPAPPSELGRRAARCGAGHVDEGGSFSWLSVAKQLRHQKVSPRCQRFRDGREISSRGLAPQGRSRPVEPGPRGRAFEILGT